MNRDKNAKLSQNNTGALPFLIFLYIIFPSFANVVGNRLEIQMQKLQAMLKGQKMTKNKKNWGKQQKQKTKLRKKKNNKKSYKNENWGK